MNDKFDELTKSLAQSVTRRAALKEFGVCRALLCLAVAAQFAWLARAEDFRRGPLLKISQERLFPDCDPGGAPPTSTGDDEVESTVGVNPRDPQNIVAMWIAHSARDNVAGVSFDGGRQWQNVIIPGLSLCSGGTFGGAGDPWLSFAPNGELYAIALGFDWAVSHSGMMVSKSTDGGLHWGSPITLADKNADSPDSVDKPSITADPTDPAVVYAVWEAYNGIENQEETTFARTTDGGSTWEPARSIYVLPGGLDYAISHQFLGLPDGKLVCLFQENLFNDANGQYDSALGLIRSTDKGQTWSKRIRIAQQFWREPTDPENGVPVTSGLPSFAVDAKRGRLYAVWEDARFSRGRYNGIAFAQSTDGGLSWSEPIPVNRTPRNIMPANRQAFLPTVAVGADGTIGVSYYDFRHNTPAPGLPTDYWLVHCHPSRRAPATDADNWSSETRLTDVPFDLEKAVLPFGGYFVGDYQALTTAGNDFLAVWSQPHGTDADSVFFRRVGPRDR